MEKKNKEKSKSYKKCTNLNVSTIDQKKNKNEDITDQNEDISTQLQSEKLRSLEELKFEDKLKKLFDSKKFLIGNHFDQKGSEQFLTEKDECLKLIGLDDTIDNKKINSKKNNKKAKKKYKKEIRKKNPDLEYIPSIKIKEENIESFFSADSSKQILKEFFSKSNEKK